MANVPTNWSALTSAKGRLIIAWDDYNAHGDTGGTEDNPPPWVSSVPNDTDAAQLDTNPCAVANVASDTHSHTTDPKYFYMGFIIRSA